MVQQAKWRVWSPSGSTWSGRIRAPMSCRRQMWCWQHCSRGSCSGLPHAFTPVCSQGTPKWGWLLSLALLLFPLFLRRSILCVFACTRWLCLLTKLCNMQKFAFLPPCISTALGETQCYRNFRCGMGSFTQKQMQPSPWGHTTAAQGQQQHRTRGVNIRYVHLVLGFSIPLNASECLACDCSSSGQRMLPFCPRAVPLASPLLLREAKGHNFA